MLISRQEDINTLKGNFVYVSSVDTGSEATFVLETLLHCFDKHAGIL